MRVCALFLSYSSKTPVIMPPNFNSQSPSGVDGKWCLESPRCGEETPSIYLELASRHLRRLCSLPQPSINISIMKRPTSLPVSFTVQGVTIPALGLSTFPGDATNEKVKDVVFKGLLCGYRHIDTAAAYLTEQAVGEGIEKSGLPREEIFVTAKLSVPLLVDTDHSLIRMN